MKMQEKCLPCVVNQAIKVADMVGMKEKGNLLRRVFSYLSKVDYNAITSPELIGEIFSIIKEETGNQDPYKETRQKYNKMFLERLPAYEKEIEQSKNPFEEAVKYAIIGNVIDFNPIHELTILDVERHFKRLKGENLEINDAALLRKELETAKTILYLGDNCGEICLDKILLRKIKAMNPKVQIFFATRGAAVVNDSIEEDAYLVGIDEVATVVSNGDSSLGTVLSRTSKEFLQIYEKADVVIAKGQANYECLSTEKKNIYFLLMTKCQVIAKDIGVPEMKMILKRSDALKK
ncbi:damage-control phosphatase ARMT1 family protein [Roseburia sp. 831b]|uniref:damage-control phosphatase ARMT1 family protein n=1 Tax=Roseburia sp. 831b TaxID=1261635 RepID=UPI000951D9E8|nr:ARMT1-like domain-containing protein [Roseburia sp. 831b]WVK74570.1 ARMT1-like domain-containing protein [Roseburia sp. 831b]